jgi:hypothetical protein
MRYTTASPPPRWVLLKENYHEDTNLETFEEEVLHRQLLQPDGVDEKDELENDVTGQSGDKKGAAAVAVRERSRQQGEHDSRHSLQHPAVRFNLRR